jgi:hypothetical protein
VAFGNPFVLIFFWPMAHSNLKLKHIDYINLIYGINFNVVLIT